MGCMALTTFSPEDPLTLVSLSPRGDTIAKEACEHAQKEFLEKTGDFYKQK